MSAGSDRLVGSPAPAGWRVATVFLLAAVLIPVLAVVMGTRGSGELAVHLARTVLPGYVWQTVIVTVGATAVAGVIGTGCAWLVTRYDFPFRRLAELLLVAPLAMPPFITAIALSGLLDPFGPLGSLFPDLETAYRALSIRSTAGLVLVLSISLYPYVFLVVRHHMRKVSGREIEVARSLGLRHPLRVALPLSRPAIAAGMGMVMMDALGEYGAAAYLGVNTLTVGLFRSWFAHGNLPAARLIATVLLLLSISSIVIEQRSRGRARYAGHATGGASVRLTHGRGVAVLALTLIPVSLGFLMPLVQLLRWASTALTPSSVGRTLTAMPASIGVSAAAALVCLTGGLVIGYLRHLAPDAPSARLGQLNYVGHAVPGAVVAVGLLSVFGAATTVIRLVNPETGPVLIGSLIGLIAGYFIRYVGVATRPLQASFEQLAAGQDAAARSLGAGTVRSLLQINLPVIRSTAVSVTLLVVLDVLKELPLTLVLRPFNFTTLAVRAFELASDERVAESALPALMLVLVSLLAIGLLYSRGDRRHLREAT